MRTVPKHRRDWNILDFLDFLGEHANWRRVVNRFRQLDEEGVLLALALGIRELTLDSVQTAPLRVRTLAEQLYGWKTSRAECLRIVTYAYSDCAEWQLMMDCFGPSCDVVHVGNQPANVDSDARRSLSYV